MPSAPTCPRVPSLLLALSAFGLVAYYLSAREPAAAPPPTVDTPAVAAAPSTAPAPTPSARPAPVGLPRYSVAGTPIPDQPLPVAKAIPVRARAGETIGYSRDADGTLRPLRAGQLNQVPNSPGTFAAVDMWADGGPAVIAVQRSQPLTPEQLAAFEQPRRGGEDGL